MTWLRALRNVRMMIWECAMIVSSLALMGSTIGMCWAIWAVVTSVLERGVK